MLVGAHIGYTVGAAWALGRITHRRRGTDYRIIAAMALLPDIIDRSFLLFAIFLSASGRLVAHTLLFELVLLLALMAINRSWWIYGAASVFHLLLDSTGLTRGGLQHLFWPLLGRSPGHFGLSSRTGSALESYPRELYQRFQETFTPYTTTPLWVWALEIGGVLVLMLFIYQKQLYRMPQLRRFIMYGTTEVTE